MPQLNRDKESLYPPGRLHVWFLFSSAALVASMVWMLGVDHFARPWKGIQRDFYRRQAALLDAQREVEQQRVLGVGTESDTAKQKREELRALAARVAEAERALTVEPVRGELARLEADVAEQQARLDEALRELKERKGKYAEVRYDYQVARAEGHAERAEALREQVDRYAAEEARYEADKIEAEAAKKALEARRAKLLEAKTAAVAALEKARREYADVEKQLAAQRSRTEKNLWRDLPVLDIVAPAIKIDKVVLEHIHDDFVFATSPKVDMCMTCHVGTNQPSMSVPAVRDLLADWIRLKVGESAWRRGKFDEWIPDRTLVSWRGVSGVKGEKKGRVGENEPISPEVRDLEIAPVRLDRDWSTARGGWREDEFRRLLGDERSHVTDLIPAKHWADAFELEDPTESGLPAAERDARRRALDEALKKTFRVQDPLKAFRVQPVQWAHSHLDLIVGPTSPHAMGKAGCTVCHAGVGLSVNFMTAAHVPDDAAEAARWKEEHGWSKPEYVDFPMLPLRHAEGQCLKCHLPNVHYAPRSEELQRWTTRLSKRTVDGVEVEFVESVRALAPNPVDGTPAQVDGRWRPERLQHGVDTMRTYACGACHLIKGFAAQPGFPRAPAPLGVDDRGPDFTVPAAGALTAQGLPKAAWDLTYIQDKTTPEFAWRWIFNPNSYRIDTRMPSFFMWREHGDDFGVDLRGGKPVDRPITFEADPELRARADAQNEVESLAIVRYLFSASKKRAAYPAPPAGDPKKGAATFYTVGCAACHLSNGLWDEGKGGWSGDAAARAVQPSGLLPGPRLTAMGSKTNPGWVFAWLEEPRHYHSTTPMPKVTWRPELAPDGTTEVRSAAQVRADVVAYLLAFKDAAFDALPLPESKDGGAPSDLHEEVLDDFWMEWYGKGQAGSPLAAPPDVATAVEFARKRPWGEKLVEVGQKLVGQRGCFGCHNIAGFEDAQPIGKELTQEGLQDIHKFDFGMMGHEIPHTRHDWIETKLREPRIFDKGTFKPRWQDRLRMPKFNFTERDRQAVTTVVLGLVRDPVDGKGEPIRPQALYQPSVAASEIEAGRAVIERYHCNQCHTIEGKLGYLTGEQLARQMELWMLPPNLFGEGNRVKSDWLFSFLKHPTGPASQDGAVRPSTIQRMPTFRLSDAEVSALVDYFKRLAGRSDRLSSDPEDVPLSDAPYPEPVTVTVGTSDAKREVTVRNQREEAAALFRAINCDKCHLPKGTPGADPNEGASAPPFTLAARRLQRAWVRDLIETPLWQIANTKMTAFWGRRRPARAGKTRRNDYPEFLLDMRGKKDATDDDVTDAQMDAIARYLLHHYEMPKFPQAEPGK
jgi:mono/diheme cytochrome c family protein